ncbi:CBS domain-containing protein [Alloiococcus sp. CFN-8]|uniref:CBS domain-containing protein n=1 Tax=Alloiococcus sp. CFN-8 TaxID=3416081 RepID=UPI003CF74B66
MNIAFFLTPKLEVIYESVEGNMKQALESMEKHGYSAIPLIDKAGRYVGTLTEGDMLWKLKNTPGLTFEKVEEIPIREIPRKTKHESVYINANIESLLTLAARQNFVPVVDDNGTFIGIIKRSDIINYINKTM